MKNHLKLASVFVFVGILLACSSAWSQGSIPTAVLNLEAQGVDSDLTETLTSVIRNEARQVENYEVVNKVAIDLEDILLVLGCNADSTVCLKRAAGELKARVLIFGRVSRHSGSYEIKLNVFDADIGEIIDSLSRTIPSTDDPIVAFQKEIELFFSKDSPQTRTMIKVGSNIENARVIIEGTFVGNVPLERKGLPPGRYTVVVEHDGYQSWESVLELKTDSLLNIWAPLKKTATPATHDQGETVNQLQADTKLDQTKVKGPNWAAWSAVGVGGAALIGSGVFAIMMSGVEQQIKDEAANGSLTEERYDDLTNRGESFELTHRVLLGVGAASLIGGTIWLLVDDRSESVATLEVGTTGTSVHARVRW